MLPKTILQTFLDDIGETVMGERFEDYTARIELPLTILTSSASLKITTVEDLQDGFDAFVEMLRSIGVTDMVRTVSNARFQGNDHVVGIYETRLMNGTQQALRIQEQQHNFQH